MCLFQFYAFLDIQLFLLIIILHYLQVGLFLLIYNKMYEFCNEILLNKLNIINYLN